MKDTLRKLALFTLSACLTFPAVAAYNPRTVTLKARSESMAAADEDFAGDIVVPEDEKVTFRITHNGNAGIYDKVEITVAKKNGSGAEVECFHHAETAVDSSAMPTFEWDTGSADPELSDGTSGPDPTPGAYTAYAKLYKDGTDPLKYTRTTTQCKVHLGPRVDILEVPEFLFASAENTTPIKWRIAGLSEPLSTEKLERVNVVFHPTSNDSIPLENPDEESGFLGYTRAIDGETSRVFETYVKPQYIQPAILPSPHVSNSASFSLKAKFGDGQTTSTLTANSGNMIKAYADNTVYARDIAPGGTGYATVTDARAVVRTEPEKRWANTIQKNMPDIWYAPSIQQTMDFDEPFQEHGYWPVPDTSCKPRFVLYDDATPETPFHTGYLLTNTTTFLGANSAGGDYFYQSVAAEEPDVDLLGWDSSMLGRGHYKGDVIANRIGVAVFISYGGKSVTVPAEEEPIKAMDLSVDTPENIRLHALDIEKMLVEVQQGQMPQTGMDHSDWVGPTVMVASIMSCWVPGFQWVGPVTGLGKALYEAAVDQVPANDQLSGHGYSTVRGWRHLSKRNDSELTEIDSGGAVGQPSHILPGMQVTTVGGGPQILLGPLPCEDIFEGEGLRVGDMFSVFIEMDTTAQMEARKTGEGTKWINAQAKVWLTNPETFKVWLSE